MPTGYRVFLGNGRLHPGNAVSDVLTGFSTDTTIGPGEWCWSGTAEGARFTSAVEPGVYYLADNGLVYFVPDLGPATSITFATVDGAPPFNLADCGRCTGNLPEIDVPETDVVETVGSGADHLTLVGNATPALRQPAYATRSTAGPADNDAIICFAEGTLIQTPCGERRIETIRPGDLVLTVDRGPQPVCWIGQKTVSASGALAPIRFAKGVFGNHRDLLVSPQHRMLFQGPTAQLLFGQSEVLAPAESLVDNYQVTIRYGGMVTYIHMLFERHEVVIANGAPSESFHPGGEGLDTLSAASRDELFTVFPDLRSDSGAYGPASRLCLHPSEARALLSA